jgi:hypothetical protein
MDLPSDEINLYGNNSLLNNFLVLYSLFSNVENKIVSLPHQNPGPVIRILRLSISKYKCLYKGIIPIVVPSNTPNMIGLRIMNNRSSMDFFRIRDLITKIIIYSRIISNMNNTYRKKRNLINLGLIISLILVIKDAFLYPLVCDCLQRPTVRGSAAWPAVHS